MSAARDVSCSLAAQSANRERRVSIRWTLFISPNELSSRKFREYPVRSTDVKRYSLPLSEDVCIESLPFRERKFSSSHQRPSLIKMRKRTLETNDVSPTRSNRAHYSYLDPGKASVCDLSVHSKLPVSPLLFPGGSLLRILGVGRTFDRIPRCWCAGMPLATIEGDATAHR